MVERKLQQMIWKIHSDEVRTTQQVSTSLGFINASSSYNKIGSSKFELESIKYEESLAESFNYEEFSLYGLTLAYYRDSLVQLIPVNKHQVFLNHNDLIDLVNLKELRHDNLQCFIGACFEAGKSFYLVQHCSRGNLQDIIENDEISLDWIFRISLISDLVNALTFIHRSKFISHGNVSSRTCYVDNRWCLKLSCLLLPVFTPRPGEPALRSGDSQDEDPYEPLVWMAPEILRAAYRPLRGTQKADVYSFSIVSQEIAFRASPFFMEDIDSKEVVERIKAGVRSDGSLFRPTPRVDLEIPELFVILTSCWAELPEERPNMEEISKQLNKLNQGKKFAVVDMALQKLEKYTTNLESIVEQRTSELLTEKKKMDVLLYNMLPTSVAEELKRGKTVPAEMHSSVTVYFSDIPGFSDLSARSTPIQVVDLLNDLYGIMDDTISKHAVYKVETISDGYMVASGLPHSNGNRHIFEISNMALDLLNVTSQFRIRHLEDVHIHLRIGIHTGACAAGVVGHVMPRYCLFGDTVNVASRMESTGEASRIHLSPAAKALLELFPIFHTELRGETFVKGKGLMETYWLIGRTDDVREASTEI